jgi:hypothetical protein
MRLVFVAAAAQKLNTTVAAQKLITKHAARAGPEMQQPTSPAAQLHTIGGCKLGDCYVPHAYALLAAALLPGHQWLHTA